jgi:DNA polymerase II large subunit
LLKNGDVIEFDSFDAGVKLIDEIDEVLFIGDQLIGIGEFFQNNYRLVPPGWNEEWWALEMIKSGWQGKNKDENDYQFFARMYYNPPDMDEAISLAKEFDVAFHPKYTPVWLYLTPKEVEQLRLEVWKTTTTVVSSDVKKILEQSLILHKVVDDGLDLGPLIEVIRFQLPNKIKVTDIDKFESGLTLVQQISPVKIKDIMGTTIGSRMGRPEKAKARLMKPQLNGLFPLGTDKKIKRLLSNAIEKGEIKVYLGNRYCTSCNKGTFNIICQECGTETIIRGKCNNPRCRADMDEAPCDICGSNISFTRSHIIDMNEYMKGVYSKIDNMPAVVRLKDQIKNPLGIPEILEKGILRARYNLNVFRDGTIRYDATDAPLTHFYPKEAKVNLEKLKELGYTFDIFGDELVSENQLLEIKPQDIILHTSSYKHLRDVANFVDDELKSIYEMSRYYNIDSPNDLIGHLVIGLAPHTSAGVIGRIIGFTDSSVCWAHPFWHSSKRRNCVDYNEELVVYNEETEQIQKIVIGEFIENLVDKGLPYEVVDDFNTKAIRNPFQHLKSISISESSLEPILTPIKNWILGRSDEWVTVTTKSGSRLRMTGNHHQLVWDEKIEQLIRKNAIELEETDILVSRGTLPEFKVNKPKKYNLLREFSEKLPIQDKFIAFKDQLRLREGGEKLKYIFTTFIADKYNDPSLKLKPRIITGHLRDMFISKFSNTGSETFTKRWYNSIPLSHIEVLIEGGAMSWDDIPLESKLGISRNDQLVPAYLEPTANLFRFIGLLLSEGYIRDEPGCYQVNISLPHKELKEETMLLSEILMGKPYFKEDNDQVVNANKIFAYLFAYAWKIGRNALNKRIPNFVFTLPRDLKLSLLEGIIDGDGSLIISTRALQIYTANQKLGEDYRLLLSSLGFSSTILEVKGMRFGDALLYIYKELGKEPNSEGVLYQVKTNGFETISLCKELRLHHPSKLSNLDAILKNNPPKSSQRKYLNSNLFLDKIKSIEIENKTENAYCVEIGDDSSNHFDHNICLLNAPITGQCDGDEDGVVLLLDGFINFSKEYLPTTRGSKMDTPLVLVVTLNPNEVDDEAFNLDSMISYPLEFYKAASEFELPSTLGSKIHRVEQRLGKPEQYEGYSYSHPTSNISEGPKTSRYKDQELDIRAKLDLQLDLAKIIRAVESRSTALRILERHVLPDLMGNLRAFASQQVRCVTCNTKYRRVPLSGHCRNKDCPKSNIILTVPPKGVSKYYDICKRLVEDYDLGVYHENRLERIRIALDSHFPEKKRVTFDLSDWLS